MLTVVSTGVVAKWQTAAEHASDRLIRPGDGRRRSAILANAQRVAQAFRWVPKIAAGILFGPAALVVAALAAPLAAGIRLAARLVPAPLLQPSLDGEVKTALEKVHPNGVEQNPETLRKLHQHAQQMKCPLSADDIRHLVVVGQNLALALNTQQHRPEANGALTIGTCTVRCNRYTARALSWYWMAVACAEGRPLPTNGAMVLPDPGQRIYRFIKHGLGTDGRPSTHFNERSLADERLSFLGLFKRPKQLGIEDPARRFPGQGGALCCDSVCGGEQGTTPHLFVKFEAAGCPAPWLHAEEGASADEHAAYAVHALDRNLQHMLNFGRTRGEREPDSQRIERSEHVHKGTLKERIYEPFMTTVQAAMEHGVIRNESVDAIDKAVRTYGLPFVERAARAILADVEAIIALKGTPSASPDVVRRAHKVRAFATGLIALIDHEREKLGKPLPDFPRRGAELHVDTLAALKALSLPAEPHAWRPVVAVPRA